MIVTRIIFTVAFLVAFGCFVCGLIAYSNRERREWYRILGTFSIIFTKFLKTKSSLIDCKILTGWVLIADSLVCLAALIIFPYFFIQKFPFYTKWFFSFGYGFGWAALCLTVCINHTKYLLELSIRFINSIYVKILAGVLFILGHGQNKKKRFTAEKRIRI